MRWTEDGGGETPPYRLTKFRVASEATFYGRPSCDLRRGPIRGLASGKASCPFPEGVSRRERRVRQTPASQSGCACLGWRGTRLPRGRHERPDLAQAKSGYSGRSAKVVSGVGRSFTPPLVGVGRGGGMNSDRGLFIPWKDMTDNLHSSDRVRSEIRVIQRSARRPKWRKVERPASGRGARFWSVFYPTRSNRTGTGNRQESGCGTLHSWP